MSMADALAGWIFIGFAAIWAGQGINALIATRRQPAARRGPVREASKWLWLTLAALQLALGVWFITGRSTHLAAQWWLGVAGGGLTIWMFITDISPWLRSRMRGQQ
jgi:hypothetical protein